jgi:hypothetical protein
MPPQCVSSSDTVREIEYQILQLPHGLELHRSVCVRCRVSGSDFGPSLFQVRARPGVDAFWTGGAFGPEASMVTLVFGLLVSAALITLAKRRKRSGLRRQRCCKELEATGKREEPGLSLPGSRR